MVLFLPPPKDDAYEPPDLVSVAATPSGGVRVVVVAPPPVLLKKQHPETWSMLEVLELVGYEIECLNAEEIEGLGQFQGKRMNVTKLQAESAPAADEWRQAIEDAINA